MAHWTVNAMPNLHGRVALVTGANRGLGLEITRALAAHGAHVLMAVRNVQQGLGVAAAIKQGIPDASLEVMALDLSSLASVHAFAAHVAETRQRLDALINNAGVIALSQRQETVDGFEMQFGTNHLGHFALTTLLIPQLVATPGSRVVTMTSNARRSVRHLDFEDLQSQRSYSRWGAYAQSKRANLLFAFELQTRFKAAGVSTISVAAHPGGANTAVPGTNSDLSRLERFIFSLVSQSAAMGALPALYATTEEHLTGGELVGPGGVAHSRGYPTVDLRAANEYDRPAAARLWAVSEELTGVRRPLLPETYSHCRGALSQVRGEGLAKALSSLTPHAQGEGFQPVEIRHERLVGRRPPPSQNGMVASCHISHISHQPPIFVHQLLGRTITAGQHQVNIRSTPPGSCSDDHYPQQKVGSWHR